MTYRIAFLALAALGLTACAQPQATGVTITELPEAVMEIAAPFQDFRDVQLLDDGCYWYRHDGPVEVTMLPLRTTFGNPICVRDPNAATEEDAGVREVRETVAS